MPAPQPLMVRWSDGPTSVTQPDGTGRESTGTVPAAGTPPTGPPGGPPPGAVVGGGLVGRLQAAVASSSATVSAPIRRRDVMVPPQGLVRLWLPTVGGRVGQRTRARCAARGTTHRHAHGDVVPESAGRDTTPTGRRRSLPGPPSRPRSSDVDIDLSGLLPLRSQRQGAR